MNFNVQSRNILVTGGTGFIGSALVARLVKLGASVRVLDNNSRGRDRRISSIASNIEFIEGDIRDAAVVNKACEGIDTVMHLAYVNGTEFFYTKPDFILDIGVKGMVNILDGAIRSGVKDFILASSSEAYQTPAQIPTPEEVPLVVPDVLNPRYSYGGGKIICELMAVNYGRKYFDRTIVFRPHNVFGPDMGWEHVIPQFAVRMQEQFQANNASEQDFVIKGDGTATRAFIYIDDFVDGIECLLAAPQGINIYHIGTMEELTIRDVALQVAKNFGKNINLRFTEAPQGETSRRCPDTTKIAKLGFKPKITFAEGVARTVSWYKENMELARK